MQIVHDNDASFKYTETKHRDPTIQQKRLINGDPGSPQNFEFALIRTPGRFRSPRHHHNFDQVRLCLEGVFGDGKKTDDLKPGDVGYYGEGTYYSIDTTDSVILILQFGGANGDGFTHYELLDKAYPELLKFGEFRDGVFFRNDRSNLPPGTKVNQDGYEALWQHIHGKPMVYPKPRYPDPVIMKPQACAWLKDPDQAGVSRQTLGVFTERLIEVGQTRVEAGASLTEQAPRAPRLFYVLSGEGHVGSEPVETGTAIHIDQGEALTVNASSDMLLFTITLPFFTEEELAMDRPTACTAAA